MNSFRAGSLPTHSDIIKTPIRGVYYVGVPGFGHDRIVIYFGLSSSYNSLRPDPVSRSRYHSTTLRLSHPRRKQGSLLAHSDKEKTPIGVNFFVGVPGFEPGVARTQNENVSRYTTLRCVDFYEVVSITLK